MGKYRFLLCGSIGWCLEILWTGLHSLERGELKLVGKSSIWMFPIYGMASLIAPLYPYLKKFPYFLRGGIYTVGIFVTEYTTGRILSQYKVCPWDYSSSPFNIQGVIRLDYAPLWFLAGLFFEKILSK